MGAKALEVCRSVSRALARRCLRQFPMQWHGVHIQRHKASWARVAELKDELGQRTLPRRVARLMTCNRVALLTSDAEAARWAEQALAGVEHERLRDREAARMLFRVAAGLDSRRTGDAHIRMQLQQSAKQCSCPELQNAMRKAVDNAEQMQLGLSTLHRDARPMCTIMTEVCTAFEIEEVLHLMPLFMLNPMVADVGSRVRLQRDVSPVPLAGVDLLVVQSGADVSRVEGRARFVLDLGQQLRAEQLHHVARENLTALLFSSLRRYSQQEQGSRESFLRGWEAPVRVAADAFYDGEWQRARAERHQRRSMVAAACKAGLDAHGVRRFMHDWAAEMRQQ